MVTKVENSVLSDDLLKRCMERAPGYDRDNTFFDEDFKELKESGYLLAAVPKELGGLGLNLAEIGQLQRRLAYHAAPTALAVNMHFYWTGLAADVWRSGDKSLEWMLTETVNDGAVFAAGHAESGNDVPVLLSTTKAERVDGGYRFTGRKSFGSLTPVWDYLGAHAMDSSDPDNRKVVHVFMPRDVPAPFRVECDVLGASVTLVDGLITDCGKRVAEGVEAHGWHGARRENAGGILPLLRNSAPPPGDAAPVECSRTRPTGGSTG